MNPVAVIDVGTNSVKLTVADTERGIKILKEDSRITRLGKNVDRDGNLNDHAIETTLDVVQEFVGAARSFGAEKIVAAGTSALRDAKNGIQFVDSVYERTGIELEIIAGDREAELSFRAVSSDLQMNIPPNSGLLVFDIGGGSTELVFGTRESMAAHTSLNIGAVRLTERCLNSDPFTTAEVEEAHRLVAEFIKQFPVAPDSVDFLCGVGGTATTFASIALGTKDIQGQKVTRDDMSRILQSLTRMTLEKRKAVPLLEPERADIIVGGGIILQEVMKQFNCDEFQVSVHGMRYGLLLELTSE